MARNLVLALNAALAVVIMLAVPGPLFLAALWMLLLAGLAFSALVGRALFYELVVPTTMPGAFFWKNKAFEHHARDMGLGAMLQVGVVNAHH